MRKSFVKQSLCRQPDDSPIGSSLGTGLLEVLEVRRREHVDLVSGNLWWHELLVPNRTEVKKTMFVCCPTVRRCSLVTYIVGTRTLRVAFMGAICCSLAADWTEALEPLRVVQGIAPYLLILQLGLRLRR